MGETKKAGASGAVQRAFQSIVGDQAHNGPARWLVVAPEPLTPPKAQTLAGALLWLPLCSPGGPMSGRFDDRERSSLHRASPDDEGISDGE
jgi:hypothetical protein